MGSLPVLALFQASPGPYIALMALGFVVGILGHVARSRATQALGIGMIFLATVLLPLLSSAVRPE